MTMVAPATRLRSPTGRLELVVAASAQPAAPANFAHALAALIIAGVQAAAALNLETVSRLLAPSDRSLGLAQTAQNWRVSCRTLQICLTTAANVLGLVQLSTEKGTEALWSAIDEYMADAGIANDQLDAIRSQFAVLRAAQEEYFRTLLQVHERLIALAAGESR